MFRNACSRFSPPRPPRQLLAGGPAEPTARCTALGPGRAPSSGKPPSCTFHRPFLYPRPFVGTDLEGGKRDPTLVPFSLLCVGESAPPGVAGPPPAPPARKVSGPRSGPELFLHPKQRSAKATPAPRGRGSHPRPQPPPPTALRRRATGAGVPGCRVSFLQLCSPKTAARGFRGELAGWGPDGEDFLPKSLSHHLPPSFLLLRLSVLRIPRERGTTLQPPTPNPRSLQCPGEGSSAFQQNPKRWNRDLPPPQPSHLLV